jgi:hypothetical protein
MTSRIQFRLAAGLAVLIAAALASGCSSPHGAISHSTVPSSTVPSSTVPQSLASAAVFSAIAASSKIRSIPANLNPSLQEFGDPAQAKTVSGVWYFKGCDAYANPAQAASPTPCIFGDVQSPKTVVLVGDSNVGNWAPALDVGLKQAGLRLDVFGFAGCPTPDIFYPSYANLTSTLVAACNRWHSTVPGVIAALHPVALVVASGAADLQGITDEEWIDGFVKLFDRSTLGSPSTARILFGTSPFPGPLPSCLAQTGNPQSCALHDQPGSGTAYASYFARDSKIAAAAKATLIPTYPWFCSTGTCSPIVGNTLVFADKDHSTLAYSQFLAPVASDAVVGALANH